MSADGTRCAASSAGKPTLYLGVVGYGLVGKEFVSQVLKQQSALETELGVRVEIAGVARSKTMALLESGGDAALASGAWPSQEVSVDLADEPADKYADWLAAGADVATPNKKAGSGPYDRYTRIMDASRTGGTQFLYEATVGAGLPILGPLKSLRQAGDEVKNVEGIFSGTLSYIFNVWKPGVKFSTIVADAKEKGFTEPDPRDDLSGTDVQRKVTILSRECGLKVELDDVTVKSLVPEKLQSWEPPAGANLADAFIKELEAYDDEMEALISEADKAGEVLRYVGGFDVATGKSSVKLGRYPKDHPFASTQFADNIVTFNTKWYDPRPLVIQGPGAGAAVTAGGIFSNVLEVMRGMKSPKSAL